MIATVGGRRDGAHTDFDVTASGHPVVACYRDADSVGAVQLGEQLAHTLAQPLVIASAYEYEPVALSSRMLPDPANERRFEAAEQRLGRVRRQLRGDLEVHERAVPADRTADALLDLACELDATAIVLGRDIDHHVTRSVLAQARCPVAVSPFTDVVGPLDTPRVIGVADDGSSGARLAVIAAWRLAGLAGAELRRLHPAEDAADNLIKASRSLDLLLCGSRGRRPVLGAILGSVSSELIGAAHCPILAIPSQSRRRDAAPLGVSTAADSDSWSLVSATS